MSFPNPDNYARDCDCGTAGANMAPPPSIFTAEIAAIEAEIAAIEAEIAAIEASIENNYTFFNNRTKFSANTNAAIATGGKTFYLAPRTDGVAGEGTIANPYDVSTAQKWFDVFSSIPNSSAGNPVTVRLAAGTYLVPYVPDGTYYYPDGISIIGEGIGITILEGAVLPNTAPASFASLISITGKRGGNYGNPYITGARQRSCIVSDMTIDCNWDLYKNSGYYIGAVNIEGVENNIIRRVRVIRFGASGSIECFPVGCSGKNTIVEECIIELPVIGVGQSAPYATYIGVGSGVHATGAGAGANGGGTWEQDLRVVEANASTDGFVQQQLYRRNDKFMFTELPDAISDYFVVGKVYYVVADSNQNNFFQLSVLPGTLTTPATPIAFPSVGGTYRGGSMNTADFLTVRNNICRGFCPELGENAKSGFGVILGSGFTRLDIHNNTFEFLTVGCYGDSWTVGTTLIKNNFFNNCRTAIRQPLSILSAQPGVDELIVEDNLFHMFGANGNSNDGNDSHFLGGSVIRTEGYFKRLAFSRNRIVSVDDKIITEALFFGGSIEACKISDNVFDRATLELTSFFCKPRTTFVQENNTDDRGIPFFLPVPQESLTVKGERNSRYGFTLYGSQAATLKQGVVQIAGYHSLSEGDFIYFYGLAQAEIDQGVLIKNEVRYYVRDIVRKRLVVGGVILDSKVTEFKLSDTVNSGQRVNLGAFNTVTPSVPKLSYTEYRNGVALTRAINAMKNQTLGIGASGSSGIVFVTTGVYDYEGLDSANPTSSLPSGFKIIGVGEKDNIILRSWNQVTIALTYGQATNVTIKNLTLSAFGPASAASAFAGGNNVFEDVVFIRQGQGTGLARVINAGEAGVGPGTTMIRCSSNDEMFDSSLSDQGNAKDGTFIDCTFTNGFPPKVAGSTFLNCNITTDRMNFFPATDPAAPVPGLIEGSTITRRTGSAEFLYLKHGTTIRNSSINVFNIKVEQSIAVDATIINTTISTAAGNTYSILKNDPVGTAPTVARYNVASNKPVDTVSTPLLILSNAFSNII